LTSITLTDTEGFSLNALYFSEIFENLRTPMHSNPSNFQHPQCRQTQDDNIYPQIVATDSGNLLQGLEQQIQQRLTSVEELALYRMGQEALSNIARHAQATKATMTLDFSNGSICLRIEDNGNGFDVPESPAEMAMTGHFGLLGIQERAELIGAKMTIDAALGNGTRLSISLPTNKDDNYAPDLAKTLSD